MMVQLAKLQLDEQSELEFKLDVFGATERPSKIQFTIEGEAFGITCPCEMTEDGVKVKIPRLKGIFESGEYKSTLSVEIEGKIFYPLTESIEFEPLVEFDIKKKKVQPIKEGVKVTLKNAVSEDVKLTKQQKLMDEVKRKGFEISEINGFNTLKKDNLFYGILGDGKVVYSSKGHTTLSEMVEELSK